MLLQMSYPEYSQPAQHSYLGLSSCCVLSKAYILCSSNMWIYIKLFVLCLLQILMLTTFSKHSSVAQVDLVLKVIYLCSKW